MAEPREWLADELERLFGETKNSSGLIGSLVYGNMPTIIAALRSPGLDRDGERMRGAAERVCHEEQMTVWTGEIVGRLSMSGYLHDDTTYEDVLGIHAVLASSIRSIVESAFSHPELSALPPRARGEGRMLSDRQKVALSWIATNRCNQSTWLGRDGEDGFRLDGPDGSITIALDDQIALRAYFKPNPLLFKGQRDRLWVLTPKGRTALSDQGERDGHG